ncbi:PPE domain-containing protein [Amycolatopsis sp. YIM 10]|uniref:PPE domain-containing protein n=1 Tax=Amycolatopsis sp. YIM 10 TaxID=2653857 RepID=UPI001290160A|nr:PPE domain-containing protein [Amycolatopsis sp. YIM 10]QFU94133.1 PPE family protein [Amycolatopsis sp. YIM 10]
MNGPLNAAQIYEQINGGPGTNWLVAAQESATGLTSTLSERAQQIADLAAKIQAGWTGEAGANAANAALPLANASIEDASLLAKAGSALEDQTSAFGTVKNSVVPVPASKPEMTSADVVEAVTTGNWNGYNNKVGEWQAKSQQNIDAFAGYHASSMGNGDTMPSSFAPLVDPGASISLAGETAAPGGGQPNGPTGGIGGGQPNTVGGSQSHAPGQGAPPPGGAGPSLVPNQQSAQNQQPAPSPSDSTKAAAYNPPPVTPTPTPPATTNTTPYVPYSGGNNNAPFIGGVVKTGPGGQLGNTGGRPGSGPIGGTGRVIGGTGNIAGGPGKVAGGPGSPTGGPGNSPGRTVGTPGGPGGMTGGPGGVTGGPGSSTGRTVGGPGGISGAAGANGRPGSTPIGGAAPGANRGEEDKEHQRPEYLLGPDPDELFGGDREKPVPPVIGETGKPA